MSTTSRLAFKGAIVALTVGALSSIGIPVYAQESQPTQKSSPAVHVEKSQQSSPAADDQENQEASPAVGVQPIPQMVPVVGAQEVPASSPFADIQKPEGTQAVVGGQSSQATSIEAGGKEADSQEEILRPITVGGTQITGYPSDWTHHRVIFTDPGSEEEAIQNGRHEEWLRVVNDPRYVLNALKRQMPAQGPAAADVATREAARARVMAIMKAASTSPDAAIPGMGGVGVEPVHPVGPTRPVSPVRPRVLSTQSKEDWNVPLTTGTNSNGVVAQLPGGTVQPNVYPAKYTFNPNGTMSCPNDYIVYPTGLAGVTGTITAPGTPNIIAYNNLDTGVLSGVTSCGTILEGVFDLNLLLNSNLSPNPTVMWAFNTGGAVTGSPILSLDGSQVAYIQQTSSSNTAAQLVLLKWSSPGNQVGLQIGLLGITIGTSEMINGYEYSYGVANIPLLSGLLSSLPSTTAPLSYGSTCAAGIPIVAPGYQGVKAGESSTGSPGAAYTCVMSLTKGGSTTPTVSHSNPFPDYLNGAIYVGDDQGYLHMFTGLAFGQPGTGSGQASSTATITEATPLKLSSLPLGAPAYDNVSGCIFVGDSAGVLYEVNPGFAGGSICKGGTPALALYAKTAQLGNSSSTGILDAPMVDSNSQAVYAFVSASTTVGGLTAGSNAIYQFQPGFTTGANPISAQAVGTGGTSLEFLDGDFDNVYYSSTNGTGNLFVVGNTHVVGTSGATPTGGTLYRVPVSSNALGTAISVATVNATVTKSSGSYAYASPVMEFCNNGGSGCTVTGGRTTTGVDIIYFSDYKGPGGILGGLQQLLGNTNCEVASLLGPGGCIYGINVSNPTSPSFYADYYTSWTGSVLNPCWVTSGFVVDNGDTSLLNLNAIGVGSQMYFVGMNGNSDSLLSTYDPCGTSKTTGNVIDAQQIGQGNLVL